MTFFFDNCVSPAIPQVLGCLGVDTLHLRDRFPSNVKDEEWIREAGKHGWVIITEDGRIRKKRPEREALKEADTVCLFLPKALAGQNKWGQVKWIVKHWQGIERHLGRAKPGQSFSVGHRSGGLELMV